MPNKFEEIHLSEPIWVLKYDMYSYPEGHELYGNFCSKDTPNAVKLTDCHGWYSSEEDALTANRNLEGNYRVEKVYRRTLRVQTA